MVYNVFCLRQVCRASMDNQEWMDFPDDRDRRANQERWAFQVLFISYKFVKGFLASTFLLLVFSSWIFHDVCQRFLYNQEQNFSLIRQKTKIFPIIKITHFCTVMFIDMSLQKWATFIIGVYGENSHFLSDPTEISFLVV